MPRSGIAGSYRSSVFSFFGTSMLFSIMVVSIYISTHSVGRFPFLTPSPAFIVCRIFDNGHADCYKKTPHSSTLAWKIPWMEEPGRLQSMGSLESDTTERLHFHFSLSCIGEGNGNPLQCSCLENPRDRGA